MATRSIPPTPKVIPFPQVQQERLDLIAQMCDCLTSIQGNFERMSGELSALKQEMEAQEAQAARKPSKTVQLVVS